MIRADDRTHPFGYAVFDLDGTLLDKDETVSEATVAGLHRLKERGLALIVASGRSPYLVGQLNLAPALLDLFEPTMVLRDGNILWHRPTESIQEMRTVSGDVVPALLAAGVAHFVVDTGLRLVATSPLAALRYALFYQCRRSAIELSDRPPHTPVTKVTVYTDLDETRRALPGIDGCQINDDAERRRCTIVPAGSCKVIGLSKLMARAYGEPTLDRVMAFGDGSNDACLLGAVGRGVAMALSHPDTVRSAALQLSGTLARYLNEELSGESGPAGRTGRNCVHRA
jgi:hydroxymethylpyrimidine pyrophosphatase-like HAD family hydrolase